MKSCYEVVVAMK